MKKLFLLLTILIGLGFGACARNNYSRDVKTLPQAAQTILAKNFKAKVSLIKIDKSFNQIKDYEVILTDGSEVTFDAKGNWVEIEVAANKSIPAGLVPKAIAHHVSQSHKGQKIITIERERTKYKVELTNGLDLEFDLSGNFLRFD